MTRQDHGSSHTSHDLSWDRPVTRRDLLRYGGAAGLGAIGASMLASCTPITDLGAIPDSGPGAPAAQARYLCMVIVDACRADYLTYGHLPNIRAMINRGTYYERAWSGILESTTPACHAAIGSGCFASHNGGILGFWWESPNSSTGDLTVVPAGTSRYALPYRPAGVPVTGQDYTCAPLEDSSQLGQPGSTRPIAPAIIEDIFRRNGTPTIAGLLKQVDPTAKVYTASGVKFYAADAAGGPHADYISYFWNDGPNTYRPLSIAGHDLPPDILADPAFRSEDYGHMNNTRPGQQDSLVVDLAMKVIERERPRIVILNLPEMDYPVCHIEGGPRSPQKVTTIMENVDRNLGRLFDHYRNLGIYDQTVFALLGDHGTVPLVQQVDRKLTFGAVFGGGTSVAGGGHCKDFHTCGLLWLEDPSKAMRVSRVMDEARIPGMSAVYFNTEFQGRKQYLPSPATIRSTDATLDAAYRYLLHTMNGDNAADIVMLYQERTGTVGAGGFTGNGHPIQWFGDHGGTSWGSQAVPMIFAGAGIRRGRRSQYPARLVDLAPTVLRLLGAPYPQLDGLALADAFEKPLSRETAAQRRMASYLMPLTAALRAQSARDVYYLETHLPANPPPGAPGLAPPGGPRY